MSDCYNLLRVYVCCPLCTYVLYYVCAVSVDQGSVLQTGVVFHNQFHGFSVQSASVNTSY